MSDDATLKNAREYFTEMAKTLRAKEGSHRGHVGSYSSPGVLMECLATWIKETVRLSEVQVQYIEEGVWSASRHDRGVSSFRRVEELARLVNSLA